MTTSGRLPGSAPGADIFLSYRRTDREFVEKLVPVLEARGLSVWWDADLEGGEDWRDAIVENLAAARCLVIVFSAACNTSEQLKKELAVADHLDKEVIPVLIEQTEPRGFFLYELARLNWISIHPAPMSKVASVAGIIVERLDAAGGTGTAEPAAAPPAPPEPTHEAGTAGLGAAVVKAPDDHAERVAAAAARTALPPPTPSATTGRSVPATIDEQRRQLRDVFLFRWVDFIVPTLVGVLAFMGSEQGDDLAVTVGTSLFAFVTILAVTELILFPVRHYRRGSNPYGVARSLVISNVVFALVASVAGVLTAASVKEEGQTINEVRISLAVMYVLFGLIIAAISFVTFVLLSRLRARKTYQHRIERI